jgi:two-component system, NarL family, response regulator NreC
MATPPGSEADHQIKIVIADDHTVMRRGLRMLLEAESGFHVLSEAGNIQAVFRDVRTHRPDVLVLDLNMPGGSSVDAIGRLTRFSPGTAVVVLTMEHDPVFMRAAYDAGASGYVLKEAAATDLVSAIRAAAGGEASELPEGPYPSGSRSPLPPPD